MSLAEASFRPYFDEMGATNLTQQLSPSFPIRASPYGTQCPPHCLAAGQAYPQKGLNGTFAQYPKIVANLTERAKTHIDTFPEHYQGIMRQNLGLQIPGEGADTFNSDIPAVGYAGVCRLFCQKPNELVSAAEGAELPRSRTLAFEQCASMCADYFAPEVSCSMLAYYKYKIEQAEEQEKEELHKRLRLITRYHTFITWSMISEGEPDLVEHRKHCLREVRLLVSPAPKEMYEEEQIARLAEPYERFQKIVAEDFPAIAEDPDFALAGAVPITHIHEAVMRWAAAPGTEPYLYQEA